MDAPEPEVPDLDEEVPASATEAGAALARDAASEIRSPEPAAPAD